MTANFRVFDVEKFCVAIDLHRIGAGLEWREVAQQVGTSAATLSRLKNGHHGPSVDTFLALCRWAAVDANEFIRPESPNRGAW